MLVAAVRIGGRRQIQNIFLLHAFPQPSLFHKFNRHSSTCSSQKPRSYIGLLSFSHFPCTIISSTPKMYPNSNLISAFPPLSPSLNHTFSHLDYCDSLLTSLWVHFCFLSLFSIIHLEWSFKTVIWLMAFRCSNNSNGFASHLEKYPKFYIIWLLATSVIRYNLLPFSPLPTGKWLFYSQSTLLFPLRRL